MCYIHVKFNEKYSQPIIICNLDGSATVDLFSLLLVYHFYSFLFYVFTMYMKNLLLVSEFKKLNLIKRINLHSP